MSRFRCLSICSFALCRFGKCMILWFGDFTPLSFDIIVICRFWYLTSFWICDPRFTYVYIFATLHFRYSWGRNLSEFDFCDFTCLLLSEFVFCECSNRHFGNIAIWWLLRFCGLKMQTWCIWLCESVLHDKTDRYRKVESAYQCWQSGVDSQTSFTEHPAFRTLATLIGRLHFTILLKWSRWFRQIFFPTAVGFGWLHPPKREYQENRRT